MFKKVSGGERLRIPHADYNAMIDAAKAHLFTKNGALPDDLPPDSLDGVILVKNTLTRDLPRFSILGLNGSIANPNYDAQQRLEFKNAIGLKGELPSSTTSGRFCVLLTDARPGEVVPAMVSGVTPVRLSVTATTDQFAEVDTAAADPTKWLKTGGVGSAQVLYVYEQTGEQWGVVRLGNRSGSEVRYVRYSHLPAAYGGTATTGLSGSAAVSNGNISPANRQIFPKLWQQSHLINSSGDLETDNAIGYCVNLGSLPLTDGWALALKMPQPHPYFGDLWAVVPDNPAHFGSANYTFESEDATNNWRFTDGDKRLVRAGSGSITGSGFSSNWAFPYGGDVMLTHMGKWEVTFGYRGYVSEGDPPYYRHNTSTASGHSHTYDLGMGFIVQFGIHRNFQAGTSVIGTNPNTTLEMRNYHASNLVTGANGKTSHERTVYLESDTAPWHGQHHTRLSPYIKVTLDPLASSTGTPYFYLDKAWMSVRPARGNGRNGAAIEERLGAGANQYPGGWNNGAGTFVWYGGGTEPPFLDTDGAEI